MMPAAQAAPAAPTAAEEEEEEWCEWRRSLQPWRARFADDCVFQLRAGAPAVRVAQAASAGRASGRRDGDGADDPGVTGSTVWDGALVLAAYLSQPATIAAIEATLRRPCARVLELGAGTGLAGLALAASGALTAPHATVVLTDLAAVLQFLEANVGRNAAALSARGAARVRVAPLRWGDAAAAAAAVAAAAAAPPPDTGATGAPQAGLDCVIGADLVYRQQNVTPLLRALATLLPPGAVAVLALDTSHCPEAVDDFRRRAAAPDAALGDDLAARYAVHDVPRAQLHPTYRCADVRVLQLWRV